MFESGKPLRISSTGATVIPYFTAKFPQKTKRFGASYGRSERSFGRMIGFWKLLNVRVEVVQIANRLWSARKKR